MSTRSPVSPRGLTLALFYLVLSFVFAGELLVPGRSLFRWDTLIYTWPMVQEARAQILAGHWPFWASSFCCGTPLLENINAGVFYPMKLLVYFLPLWPGYQLFLFVHVWLTFLFTHLFLQRGLKLRASAAVVGALAFGASGYMRSMWDTHNFYAMPWIPLALWIAVWSDGGSPSQRFGIRRKQILAMAACFVMLIYGGDLEQAILTVPAIFLLILFSPRLRVSASPCLADSPTPPLPGSPARALFATLLTITAGILLGLLLSAPQLLPAWDWSHYSYRAAGMPLAEAAERSFHPRRLIELVLPHFYGTRDGWQGTHLAYGTKTVPWCSSFHIGLVPFLLAVAALFCSVAALFRSLRSEPKTGDRNVPATECSGHNLVSAVGDQNVPATVWALLLFLGGLLLAIGGFIPPLFKLVHALPLLGSFRYPEKYLLWSTLGLATLAALGADHVLGSSAVGRMQFLRYPRSSLLALCLVSLLYPWYKELPTTNRFDPLDTPQFLIPIVNSDDPQGRIFIDPAIKNVPLPPDYKSLRPSEREAIYLRESLAFNSPRLWGCRTAGGFSPAESGKMRSWREEIERSGVVRPVDSLGTRWLFTATNKLGEFPSPVELVEKWGNPPKVVLVKRPPVNDAFGINAYAVEHPAESWRPGPAEVVIHGLRGCHVAGIAESRAAGWSCAGDSAMLRAPITPDSDELRLKYEPPMWRTSLVVALGGVLAFLGLLLRPCFRPLRACAAGESVPQATPERTPSSPPSSAAEDRESSDGPASELPLLPGKPAGGVVGQDGKVDSLGSPIGSRPGPLRACPAGESVPQATPERTPSSPPSSAAEDRESSDGLASELPLLPGRPAGGDGGKPAGGVPARGIVARSATTTLVCCLVFVVLGLAARSHWSATFDEGFHLGRGLALRHFHDSRLSFFHPPVQNWLGAYFADLAFADRIRMPKDATWKMADSSGYAVSLAKANPDVFNEAIRAARWSSLLFGVLLVAVGVWWAKALGRANRPARRRRIRLWRGEPGGPAGTPRSTSSLAGWLAGLGLALNPNLIAHGNLNTTDIGVTSLVFAGTAVLWKACRDRSTFPLVLAAVLFTLAGVTKFTGLIWLASLLFVVVPVLAWRWKARRILWLIPANVAVLAGVILWLYGAEAQAIRDIQNAKVVTVAKFPGGRFLEGILLQSRHALEGHKAWFHGELFEKSEWWHMPAAVVLKAPEVWLVGVLLALGMFAARARREDGTQVSGVRFQVSEGLLPFLPALVFTFLLFFVNNMAIGVRHALPLVALGTMAGAVAIARIPMARGRKFATAAFAGGMMLSAATSFPNYLSYFPAWAGGVDHGCDWMVDSNYDWGQGLDELEENWAALTAENGGEPPNLVYYGFSDPRVTHKLRVGPNSYCGFMDAMTSAGGVKDRLAGAKGLLVVSLSAPPLQPHGLDFGILRGAEFVKRIGTSYEVFRIGGNGGRP